MSTYLDHLEDSTNVVKSKNRFSKLLLLLTYLVIWIISLVSFWIFSRGDALGHTILFLLVILPVSTLIISFLIGQNDYWGRGKWLFSLLFGTMYMLADYATFRAAHMVWMNQIEPPDFSMLPVGAMISLVGLGLGFAVNQARVRKKALKKGR